MSTSAQNFVKELSSDEERVLLLPQHTIDPQLEVHDNYIYLDDDEILHESDEDSGESSDKLDEFQPVDESAPANDHKLKRDRNDGESFEDDLEDDHENDHIDEDNLVREFTPVLETQERHPHLGRRLSRTDAESIVGGESISELHNDVELEEEEEEEEEEEQKQKADTDTDTDAKAKVGPGKQASLLLLLHPISDPNLPTEEQPHKVGDDTFKSYNMKKYNQSQKVFSFALPFGGLESIKHNLTRQLQNLKIDMPFVGGNEDEKLKNLRKDVELKLERQQTISTQDEENYFRDFKGTDAGRFRAIKHTISANVNEILPHKKKELQDYESIYERIDGNIVIMGGYRGSILRDTKTKKRVWIPIKAGFHLRKIDLLLGPNKEDEIYAERKLYPDGVLKNVGPIDICKKLINRLDANPNVNIKEFGYDWRLGGDYVSKKLEEFLQKIHDETGKPTLVIAHSMGGLMAHGTLQRNPKLFRSIVYVGSPSECLNILGPIRFGDSVILSDKILTYESNFMMRSSFIFLPMSGEAFYNKDTKENYKIDYFNPDNWVEYNLNPLVAKKRKIAAEAVALSSASSSLSSISRSQSSLSQQPRTVSSSTSSAAATTTATLLPPNSAPLQSPSTLSFPSINLIGSTISKMYRSTSLKKKATAPSSPNPGSKSIFNNGNSNNSNNKDTKDNKSSNRNSNSAAIAVPENEHYSFTFQDAYRYLSETLSATKKYVESLEYNPALAAEYPPMAIVYGNTIPSVRGSLVRLREDIKNGNYYEFFYGHGDGVIHQKWLMPERKGFTFYDKSTGTGEIVGKFASTSAHVNLMTDHDTMGKALNAVYEAEQFWERKKKLQRSTSPTEHGQNYVKVTVSKNIQT
ncbi:conserved hypothetical protein [Lodderomyces elongisporus NRRL YB-4239]|uniref:Uncharacterized protein n=1 Tax=Lodderomyces elongisporus (strain ATCC 11503 / CBS 2605 / JCM 1781 / NBRC 1676 / NRRL YB-4239) TaxID=379508 RepID=A5E0K6_LODEL|nr:conserved hypothetical protein [Lodderomyces elongisporus NRRL YB-4239]